MNKVMIKMVDGTTMLFPVEYAKKIMRKNALVELVLNYQEQMKTLETDSILNSHLEHEIKRAVNQIRRINRQVPPCGEVVR